MVALPKTIEKNKLIAIIVIILLIAVAILAYYYFFVLSKGPPGAPGETRAGIQFLFAIYGHGGERGMLKKPLDVATDRAGNIYVSDTQNARIQVYNRRGRFKFEFGRRGTGKGEFQFPYGIDVDRRGNIYVCDTYDDTIKIFSSRGKFLREIIQWHPLVLDVTEGKIYVTSPYEIVIFSTEGKVLKRWGKRGPEPGQFDFPNGIAVDAEGNIYVSDGNNTRLQAFDKEGKVRWVFGKRVVGMTVKERAFGLPRTMALDEKNRLYVVDGFHHAIRVFTSKGKDLGELGERGEGEGQFNFPSGIAHVEGNTFYIADKENNRVQAVRIWVPKAKK